MTGLLARVTARLLGFAAWLLAGTGRVFALAGSVTALATVVGAASESAAADEPTRHLGAPARLILQPLLAA